jgi:hypothetical protein
VFPKQPCSESPLCSKFPVNANSSGFTNLAESGRQAFSMVALRPQSLLARRPRCDCGKESRLILVENLDGAALCCWIQRSKCISTGQQDGP